MVHYEGDFQKGTKAQTEIFPIVKKYFEDFNLNGEIRENMDENAKYDYECDDAVFEVKTRFDVSRDTYNTTMITCNKVSDTNKSIIFIFNYTDEISWIQYEEELLELNQYTNLQPLCSYHNRWVKSDNILEKDA